MFKWTIRRGKLTRDAYVSKEHVMFFIDKLVKAIDEDVDIRENYDEESLYAIICAIGCLMKAHDMPIDFDKSISEGMPAFKNGYYELFEYIEEMKALMKKAANG